MRNWDSLADGELNGPTKTSGICPQEEDYNDALKVCEKLNIPLHRVDFVKEYTKLFRISFFLRTSYCCRYNRHRYYYCL